MESMAEKAYGFDRYYNDNPPTLVPSTWSKNYGIGLYGRIGLICHNLQKGTNLKFKRLEKHTTELTGYLSYYITLEATDPATGSVCSFQTQFSDAGSRIYCSNLNILIFPNLTYQTMFLFFLILTQLGLVFLGLQVNIKFTFSSISLGARITWFTIASRIKQIRNEPVDDEWEEEDTPGIHEFYKVPMPKWFSDEALERDSKKCQNQICMTMTGFNFSWKSPSSPKQIVYCLDAYLPLELKNVVVETFEYYTTVSGVAVQDVLSPPITTQSVYMKKKIRRT
uniref:Cystatin domain-containing protein n=1 Tax=Brassica oleracea var. oleracea TaxID=109376 RepID=A0A0D3BMA3_BRAOL